MTGTTTDTDIWLGVAFNVTARNGIDFTNSQWAYFDI